MAWWDHEELKDPKYRSDRYKLAFPTGYTQQELDEARARQEQSDMTTPWKMHQDQSGGIPAPPPAPLEPQLRVGVGGAPAAALQPDFRRVDVVDIERAPAQQEKLFVFTEHEYENNGTLEVFEVNDFDGVVAHLEEREEENPDVDLEITVIRGVQVPVKKGSYTIG